jgi:DEAD/DEAH box helicase domain-containing protein
MVHSGILPNHPKWIKFLKSLRYIVIDELHIYRGVFGSHMTNLLRRLKRLLAFYNSHPVFICCSATIGNPKQLAENLLEEEVQLVDNNGSPSGERHFIFYNPPLVDPIQGIRRGVVLESRALASRFLKAGIKTIVFARSRVRTELIANYIRESLKNFYTDNYNIKIASYRGGYLPNERRAIEKGLREGEIHGVVSTNALELGIDIGGLDVSILADFPGSIASSWQQAGRAGRSNDVSVSILVASSSPMSQYIMRHPEYFFSQSPESGWVDPNNMYILMDQLKCALFELPFNDGEGFRENVDELLCFLEENGVIRHTGGKWYWSDRSYPAEKVSLRTSTTENVVIIDTTKGQNKVIGEMDRPSAKMLLFDKAVYLHMGNQFQVKQLDIANKKCYVEEADLNYYTDSVVKSDIKLLHRDLEEKLYKIRLLMGDILVRTAVTKFKKLKFMTHENIGYGEISLPEEEMHTRSILLIFDSRETPGKYFETLPDKAKGMVLKAVGFLIQQVAPLFLLCDTRDLGIAERIKEIGIDDPCIYVYDTYPGGSGLADGFLHNAESIIKGCLEVVSACVCASGCPACIGPAEESEEDFNPKQPVVQLLASIFK